MNPARKQTFQRTGLSVAAGTLLLWGVACHPEPAPVVPKLDADGVLALLDVVDAVAAAHPDAAVDLHAFRSLPDSTRDRLCADAQESNQANASVTDAVDRMLDTEAYRLYFRRFHNVTPESMRRMILNLPYSGGNGPGGIDDMLAELLVQRKTVRAAVGRFVAGVDMGDVVQRARAWAPRDSRVPARMFLIYDSNAGSFTAEGVPFFNLLDKLDCDALDFDSTAGASQRAVAIMAHELEHVLVAPYLYPSSRPQSPWQTEWLDRITRGLVSEGLAIHCNPPEGFRQELWEDSTVVCALIGRLNALLVSLAGDTLTEADATAWYDDNFQSYADSLLVAYLAARYSGDDLTSMHTGNAAVRPDLEHVLGWWMVSRISDEGRHPEAALGLLNDPYELYMRYNGAVGPTHPGLSISPEAIRSVAALQQQG